MSERQARSFPHCYVCGSENPAGLHVGFSPDPSGGSRAEYIARQEHAGFPGIIHGGLLFTLMDEAVAWACIYAGATCVTATAEVRFRSPARVGMHLIVTGRVSFASRRAMRAVAEIRDGQEGGLVAELQAMMAIADRRPVTEGSHDSTAEREQ